MRKLDDVKIFTTGDFRDGEARFTETDLRLIANNEIKFKDKIVPVLKFSHGDKQVMLRAIATKYGFDVSEKEMMGEGVFGVGRISGLYVKDETLFAKEISDIPEKFVEFINDQSARRFSPEFYKLPDNTRALRALAIVDIPENKNMEYITFSEEDYKLEEKTKEETKMSEKLTAENAALKTEIEKLAEKNLQLAVQLKTEKIAGKVKDHLNAGQISKGQETVVTEIYKEIYGIAVEKFDETKVSKFEEFVNTLKTVDLETKTESHKVEDAKKEKFEEKKPETDKFDEMETGIRKIMDTQKLSYGQAQIKYFEKGE